MDNKNIVGLIMAGVIGVILIGALLAPTIDSYADEKRTYLNDGVPFAEYDGNEHVIVITSVDGAASLTVDGEAVETPLFYNNNSTIVYGDNGIVRMNKNGNIRIFVDSFQGLNIADGDITITITEGQVVAQNAANTRTVSLNALAYIAPEGDYVQAKNPVVGEDSVIIGGTTDVTVTDFFTIVAYGPVDDLTVTPAYSNIADIAYVSYDVDSSPAGYGDLIKINSIDFTMDDDGADVVGHYSLFLAPEKVQYDNPDYIGGASAPMLGAVVILCLAALIIGAVAFLRPRD